MGQSESTANTGNADSFDSIIPQPFIFGADSKTEVIQEAIQSASLSNSSLHLKLGSLEPSQLVEEPSYSQFEMQLSQISEHIYVSGEGVATSRDILIDAGISRIINCSHITTANAFAADPTFCYLSLNLYDSKQENIAWFIPHVLLFIDAAKAAGAKVLIHCEKGISRSCAFAIAYHMWKHRCPFPDAFAAVKCHRSICNPNAAFICQLVEFQNFLSAPLGSYWFRCASHAVYDWDTPVLKLWTDSSRRPLTPRRVDLLSLGVYVYCSGVHVYLWKGASSADSAVQASLAMTAGLLRLLGVTFEVMIVDEGSEPAAFLQCLETESEASLLDQHDVYGAAVPVAAGAVDVVDVEVGASITVKPRLFLAEAAGGRITWTPLGIYDDGDLDEVSHSHYFAVHSDRYDVDFIALVVLWRESVQFCLGRQRSRRRFRRFSRGGR